MYIIDKIEHTIESKTKGGDGVVTYHELRVGIDDAPAIVRRFNLAWQEYDGDTGVGEGWCADTEDADAHGGLLIPPTVLEACEHDANGLCISCGKGSRLFARLMCSGCADKLMKAVEWSGRMKAKS
jgi:hypothetical protein